jgi:hypothetical protein
VLGGFEKVRIQMLTLGHLHSNDGRRDQRAQNSAPKITQNYFPIHILGVALRIIWPNFLRAIWHIGVTSYPTDHKASGRRVDPSTNSFVTCSSQLISRIRRISDQNMLQKSNVSAGDSDGRLCQISSK